MGIIFSLIFLGSAILLPVGLINPRWVWINKLGKPSRKKSTALFGGVAFISLIVLGLSSSPDQLQEGLNSAETVGAASTETEDSTVQEQAEDEVEGVAEGEDFTEAVEGVEFGGRKIVVTGTEQPTEINLNDGFTDPITGNIVVVRFSVENTSNETGNLAFSQFELIDSQNRKYDEITDLTYSMWRDQQGIPSRAEEYYPGESRAELAAFRVAPDASGFKLQWKGRTIELGI